MSIEADAGDIGYPVDEDNPEYYDDQEIDYNDRALDVQDEEFAPPAEEEVKDNLAPEAGADDEKGLEDAQDAVDEDDDEVEQDNLVELQEPVPTPQIKATVITPGPGLPPITTDFLSKYERIRAIGARAEMIARGSPITVATNQTDPLKIAEEELAAKRCPLFIDRPLGNNLFERRDINQLVDLKHMEE